MMLLPFQADANRRARLGWPWLHDRFVGVVALGTGEYDAFILPAAYPLSMATEIPVLLTIGMAGTANEVRLIEIDFLVTRRAEKIYVIAVVAGKAPEPVAAVINFANVPCLQSAGFRISVAFLVATRTVSEFQLFVAWLDRECGGFGVELISSQAHINLLGTGDARQCECDNHRQPSQH
jgi:hypothetical protein